MYLLKGENFEMKNLLFKLCSFALVIATIAPNTCRGNWYQPLEPEGLEKFFENR